MANEKLFDMSYLPQLYSLYWNSPRNDCNTSFWSDRDLSTSFSHDDILEDILNLIEDDDEPKTNDDNSSVEGSHQSTGMTTSHLNPDIVTISSKSSSSSSKQIGFKKIIPVSLNEGENKTRKKESTTPIICNFCRNDPEFRRNCLTHRLKDPTTNVLLCPNLRRFICKFCGGTGDSAHTTKYCPMKKWMKEESAERSSGTAASTQKKFFYG